MFFTRFKNIFNRKTNKINARKQGSTNNESKSECSSIKSKIFSLSSFAVFFSSILLPLSIIILLWFIVTDVIVEKNKWSDAFKNSEISIIFAIMSILIFIGSLSIFIIFKYDFKCNKSTLAGTIISFVRKMLSDEFFGIIATFPEDPLSWIPIAIIIIMIIFLILGIIGTVLYHKDKKTSMEKLAFIGWAGFLFVPVTLILMLILSHTLFSSNNFLTKLINKI